MHCRFAQKVYYLHLSNPDGQAWSSEALLDRIVIQRSKKAGKRWNKGAGMGLNGSKDQDKEWAVSTDGSTLLTCWTQFDLYGSPAEADNTVILCSTSNRKAKKWSDPVRINAIAGDCRDGDETVKGQSPTSPQTACGVGTSRYNLDGPQHRRW